MTASDKKQPAIHIAHLSKTYPKGLTAVNDISFDVEQGDFFALLGPNGAGKTTTIGMLSSLVTKTAGNIQILDANLDKRPQLAKSYLGIMPQEINLNVFETAIDILYHQASYYGMTRRQTLERATLLLKKAELWQYRHAKVLTFSGGMKRRLMVVRALIHNPRILILDEPTAGVDIEIRQSMWTFLRTLNQQGLTIILTTHYLEEAENLCNRIAIINKGRLLQLTSMHKLLSSLETETLVLTLSERFSGEHFRLSVPWRCVDGWTLEIDLPKAISLSVVMQEMHQQHLSIQRVRNKRNRLEQLFLDLVQKNQEELDA